MSATPAIVTEGLTRAYSAASGVWELDLHVPQGAIYAFLGPNGAGKTTTIRLLLGLLRADAGRILIDGRALEINAAHRPWIGSMVEGPSLYPHLSGRENLAIAARLLRATRQEREAVLDTVGLADAGDKLVRQYSLGMRQRLGIALALLGHPRLLVLDEPSNGLDPAGMADLRALMQHLVREAGMTIFLSSHQLGDVEKVATHAGLLHRGRLLAQGALDTLRNRRVRVGCGEPARAYQLLDAAGYRVERDAADGLSVDAPDASAAGINRLLVSAGIEVHQLQAGQDSLEEFFAAATAIERAA